MNSVKATCVVELQIECDSCWSEDTTMQQIIKQATDDATGRLRQVFQDAGTDDKDLSCKRSGSRGIALSGVKQISVRAIQQR